MTERSSPLDSERQALVHLLLNSGAVRFGKFTLTSGQTSDVYVDVKRAWTDPRRLDLISAALARRVGSVDRLAGMELGAVPLVVATSLRTRLPYVVIRKAARTHGTQQRYEGDVPAGDRILVIEDVATTGGSASESVEILRSAGGKVDRVLVLVDREMGARARLESLGVSFEAIVTLREVRGTPA